MWEAIKTSEVAQSLVFSALLLLCVYGARRLQLYRQNGAGAQPSGSEFKGESVAVEAESAYLASFPNLVDIQATPAEREQIGRDKVLYHQLQNLELYPGMSTLWRIS